jgi:hypothetical protein
LVRSGQLSGIRPANTLYKSDRKRIINAMAKRVFISFDYDHDSDLRVMLAGQAKHPDTPFSIADWSVKEELSGDWKKKVRERIRKVDIVVVICGESTHTASGVSTEIRIAQDESVTYFLLWGRNGKNVTKPTAARTTDKIYDWTWPTLKRLIGGER